jgi:uncharacterized protein (UPF0332 family)
MRLAEEFLAEAKDLANTCHSNAFRRRTAVSRAYYGVYHGLLRKAVSLGYQMPANQSKHVALINWWKIFDDAGREWATTATWLKERRQKANYGNGFSLTASDVKDVIEQSEELLAELSET